jgi:diphosphomevalonate decarboxylase
LLDRVREASGMLERARVASHNDFPTASGLASSASGFAALALAASSAAGLSLGPARLSSLARRSSASAARSCFGGFVALGAEADSDEPVAPPDHWDVALIVVETSSAEKPVGSGPGMLHTEKTSPYYAAWLEHAPRLYQEIRAAVSSRDIEALGPAIEQSALAMHACMLASRPSLFYWSPSTLSVLERVRELQREQVLAFFTIDAGPHVKVFTLNSLAERVAGACREVSGVVRVRVCPPGAGARLVDDLEQTP